MKKILFSAIIALLTFAMSFAQQRFQMPKMPENVILSLRDNSPQSTEGRSANFAPAFIIYPDVALDSLAAVALVDELGIKEIISAFRASVTVLNPSSDKYDELADYEVFETMYNFVGRGGNLKIIAIGNGATFVNQVIVPQAAGAIAGILSIDGKAARANRAKSYGVPVYVAGKNAKSVAASYNSFNGATLLSSEGNKSVYVNSNEPLLKTVVNTARNCSLDELFADAWKSVFSKNYRFNNYKHTHYEGCQLNEFGPNELEPFTIHEDLGIKRNVVTLEQRNSKPWLWYEYWPEELLEGAPAKSVPIMVLLHGNTNDPRTQAETSGFIEVAAEDRFFVVEMEWQGSNTAGAMGLDGVEQVLSIICSKYPQLDPSRIYCEGLSAGSMTSVQIGVRKSYLFAAVGGHSGGLSSGLFGNSPTSVFGYDSSITNEIAQKAGFVEMAFFLITGSADRVVPFYNQENYKNNGILNAWNAYRKLNGIPEAVEIDFGKYPVFGFELQDRETIVTNKGLGITVETGVLYKDGVPLVKCGLVMDYGHWNFKPDARIMWDYFKHFSRDLETKKLIYTE